MSEAANIVIARCLRRLLHRSAPEHRFSAEADALDAINALSKLERVIQEAQILRQDLQAGEEWNLDPLCKELEEAGFPLSPRM